MIIRSHQMSNLWYRSAIFSMFALTLSLAFIWAAFGTQGYESEFSLVSFLIPPSVALVLWFIGLFFRTPIRLKHFSVLIGLFVCFSAYFLTFTPIFIVLALPGLLLNMKILIIFLYVFVTFVWCYRRVAKLRYVIRRCEYFQHELKEAGQAEFFINGDTARDIRKFEKKFSKNPERNFRWLLPIIVPLSSIGYPLQKVLAQNGGAVSVFAFCSIFCIPMSIYVLSEMSSGFYMWVYLVNKIEKERRAKIILVNNP